MSTSTLIAHCGARILDRAALDLIEPPEETASWKPIKHSVVIDRVADAMRAANFNPTGMKFAVARDNHPLFATIDTTTGLYGAEVTLAVAVVNSTDKSLPMKFVAGSRVFCCDNLSLRSDLMEPVRRKHTRNGLTRFTEALQLAVAGLDAFKSAETARIKHYQTKEITNDTRDAILLRSFDRGLISHRLLPKVIAEARKPSFDYGCDVNTLWTLEQAFTTVLGRTLLGSNPQRFTAASLSIQELLSECANFPSTPPLYTPA